jgi:glycosyltransferase involved in cell wall biosynthesis
LFAGRITALKGARLLADAVADAQTRLNAPLRLIVAGEGPERAALEKRAKALNLEASFTGWVTGSERLALFRRSSVLAIPSVWPEPFGLVGLEAASVGVPTVAFDVGGIWEWLRDGFNGRLVNPAGGAPAFGEALAGILADSRALAALSAGAIARAQDLTVARHVAKIEHVLARAAGTAVAIA